MIAYIYKVERMFHGSVQFPAFLRASAPQTTRTQRDRARDCRRAQARERFSQTRAHDVQHTRGGAERRQPVGSPRPPLSRQVRLVFFRTPAVASSARTSRKKLVGTRTQRLRAIHVVRDLESRGEKALYYSSLPRSPLLPVPCVLRSHPSTSSVEDYFIIRAGLAAVMVCILNISKIAFLGNSSHNGNTWNIIPG